MAKRHALIKDLLVLYADGMVSDKTKQIIELHLQSCRECNQMLKKIKDEENDPVLPLDHHHIENEAHLEQGKNFITRLKKLGLIVGSVCIGLFVVFALSSWILGKETAQKKFLRQDLAHDQELIQLDNELISLSPSQKEIYNQIDLHINFTERSFLENKTTITYRYSWDNANIDYIREDVYWPNHLIAMDLTNNEVMDRIQNTGSMGKTENAQTWILGGIKENTKMVGIQLPNIAAFFKPVDFSLLINNKGSTPIQKKLKINHVRFLIQKVTVKNSRIYIHYKQLDQVSDVGLYELSFSILDENGHYWSKEPKIDFQIQEGRVAEIPIYRDMKKPYILHLEHAVLIIPGMHYKFSVTP